jgi:hypothetical protein
MKRNGCLNEICEINDDDDNDKDDDYYDDYDNGDHDDNENDDGDDDDDDNDDGNNNDNNNDDDGNIPIVPSSHAHIELHIYSEGQLIYIHIPAKNPTVPITHINHKIV